MITDSRILGPPLTIHAWLPYVDRSGFCPDMPCISHERVGILTEKCPGFYAYSSDNGNIYMCMYGKLYPRPRLSWTLNISWGLLLDLLYFCKVYAKFNHSTVKSVIIFMEDPTISYPGTKEEKNPTNPVSISGDNLPFSS